MFNIFTTTERLFASYVYLEIDADRCLVIEDPVTENGSELFKVVPKPVGTTINIVGGGDYQGFLERFLAKLPKLLRDSRTLDALQVVLHTIDNRRSVL